MPSGSWIVNRFRHFHTSHAEIKPLTAAVVVGSIVASLFPIYSLCQNMRLGVGEGKKVAWYNYLVPAAQKKHTGSDPEMEKLRDELTKQANKKE